MDLSSQRAHMVEHRFRLVVPADLLCQIGQPAWEDQIALYKLDDKKAFPFDEDDWVAKAGYPPLREIIHDHDELDFMFGVGGNLVHQTLPTIFRAHRWAEIEASKPYYLDRRTVEKVEEMIVWTGSCYQDAR